LILGRQVSGTASGPAALSASGPAALSASGPAALSASGPAALSAGGFAAGFLPNWNGYLQSQSAIHPGTWLARR
jgi:hypothetical protein